MGHQPLSKPEKPNVLLLTIDTLRRDRVGCYGHPDAITPNIDRLAQSGIRFEQAITGGSWTQAAFPVLLTSTYAAMYGGCLGPLSPERPSPVEALAAAGYKTAGFSTSPLLSRTYGYDRGYDYFVDLLPEESDPFLRRVKGGQRLLRQELTHRFSTLLGRRTRPARLYVSGAELTQRMCRWLGKVSEPFFIWGHYMDVHWPYYLEESLVHAREIAQAWRDLGLMHSANRKNLSLTATQRARYEALYEQAVQYADAQVGRVISYLDSNGLLGNTIVVVTSDHGEEFLERRRWGHFETNLHDEIVKVPLIIRLPEASDCRVVQHQVRLLDLMPTILDLVGCPAPAGMEGASLRPLWTAQGSEHDGRLSISEMLRGDWHIVAIRTEEYKYIWNSRQPDQPELYDLRADAAERRNLSRQLPALARQFQAIVDGHLARVAAQGRLAEAAAAPELDEHVIQRLRDLGYVE
jgi:arylsulfatase A-like enzyme